MSIEPERNFQIVSLVATYEPRDAPLISLGPPEIEAIENELDVEIQVGQSVSERGAGSVITNQGSQIQLSFLNDRLESRSLQPQFTSDTASEIVDLFAAVKSQMPRMPWSRLGYNYVVSIRAHDIAIRVLGKSLVKEDLDDMLGVHLLGAAGWLWLEVEEDTLWVKLEPRRSSPTTHTIRVNANFEPPAIDDSEMPSSKALTDSLLDRWTQLDSVLKKLDL